MSTKALDVEALGVRLVLSEPVDGREDLLHRRMVAGLVAGIAVNHLTTAPNHEDASLLAWRTLRTGLAKAGAEGPQSVAKNFQTKGGEQAGLHPRELVRLQRRVGVERHLEAELLVKASRHVGSAVADHDELRAL